MTPFAKAWRGLKAAVVRFGTGWGTGWRWGGQLGSTVWDYERAVGDGRGNAAVLACVRWMARTFPEAPARIRTRAGNDLTPLPEHPLVVLLDRPNPYYSGHLLWSATLADWLLDGNAYWRKQRNGAGKVVALWWLPAFTMEPKWERETDFVSFYEYSPGGSPERLDPADVVHFRYGLDPDNVRKGCSDIKALLREIFTDNEAANYTASILRNTGVPGVVITGKDITPDNAEQIKAEMKQRFGGDRRGDPLVLGGDMKPSVLSFSPEQMQLRELRRIPEERISAIFGTPAVVVGLGAGLDRSTFANFAEAREAAYESNIIPTQRLMAAELRTQLLPDFGDAGSLVLDFDLSQVRVLQPDEDKLYTRVGGAVTHGLLTVNEGRRMLGREPLAEGDVLLVPTTVSVTDPALLLAPPEPRPALPPPDGLPALPAPKLRAIMAAMAKRSERVVPLGAGEPWADLPAEPTLDDAGLGRLLKAWDEVVGPEYAGLLDAEPTDG